MNTVHNSTHAVQKNSTHAVHLYEPNKCAKFFSYQGPNKNICGVACFFTAVLHADLVVFQNQTNQPIKWLNQLHNYDSFSSCVMIKWYVEYSIYSIVL